MNERGKLTRRGFLGLLGGGAAAVLAGCTKPTPPAPHLDTTDFDPLEFYPYRGWESLYREQFTWDKVVRSTHSANCTGSCSWMVYVKDGVMLREEQASDYPRINDDLPDYNPRGCQKGVGFVEFVQGDRKGRSTVLHGVAPWPHGRKEVDWYYACPPVIRFSTAPPRRRRGRIENSS
jgi:anaerobic selenocysteine-containing dehydrogenase